MTGREIKAEIERLTLPHVELNKEIDNARFAYAQSGTKRDTKPDKKVTEQRSFAVSNSRKPLMFPRITNQTKPVAILMGLI